MRKRTLGIIIGLVLFIMVMLIGIALYSRASISKLSLSSQVKPSGPIQISASIVSSGFFTYSSGQLAAEYALVNYSISNATNGTAKIAVYSHNPIERIYLVNTTNYYVSSFPLAALYASLKGYLLRYGLLFNSSSLSIVQLANLSSVANHSIVIIPSGLLPVPMVENSSISIFKMLDRGDTVIYVGQDFSHIVAAGGIIVLTPANVTSALTTYGLVTSQVSSPSAGIYCNKPAYVFYKGSLYNGATYVASSNGTFIALPNYPTLCEKNASDLAYAIASMIFADFWTTPLAYGTENLSALSGLSGLYTNSSSLFIQSPINATNPLLNSTYSLLTISASNATQTKYLEIPFFSKSRLMALMSVPAKVGVSQSADLEINISAPIPLEFHIDILNSTGKFVESIPIVYSFFGKISILKPVTFNLPPGLYLAYLKNQTNYIYSQAIFTVAPLQITPVALNFKNDTFVFSVYSNGNPVNAQVQVSLNNAYPETIQITNGTMVYALPRGTILAYGPQVFDISLYGQHIYYSTTYSKKIFHIPAFYIEVGVVLISILLLNIIVKPPNRDEFYIDVPTFLWQKKEVINAKPADLLSIFEKVDFYHHWSFVPITLDEFRSGITNFMHYGSLPIAITSSNAQELLDSLVRSGQLNEKNGYYAPSNWQALSKHDIEYLVIYRQLIDYFVSQGMLFTPLNADPNYDILVTKSGRQAGIIIYSSVSKMRKFEISNKIPVYIVFIDEDTKEEFIKTLNRSFTKEAEILKVAIQYGQVKLVSVENLQSLIL